MPKTPKKRKKKKDPPPNGIVLAIFVAIVTAAVGYFFSVVQDQRKREIDFVDQQIEKLYGPLFALSTATKRAAQQVLFIVRPGKGRFFDEHDPPTPAEVERWRQWIKTVFQPMNQKMETAIVDNAQLIEGGHIYPVFADLVLHVESYKGIIAKWKDTDAKENSHFTDRSENAAVNEFPKDFDICVEQRFVAMLAKRACLKSSWIFPLQSCENHTTFPKDCQ